MPTVRTAKFGGSTKISVKVTGPGAAATDVHLSRASEGAELVGDEIENPNTVYLVGKNTVIEIVGMGSFGPIRIKPPPPPPPFEDGDWIQIQIG